MSAMTIATDIHTDLPHPGAYLRLRGGRRGAFLLESVEKGRLGRYSLVAAGVAPRVVRRGGDRRRSGLAGRRLPRLRPRGPPRADGAAAGGRARLPGEPLRRRGHARPLRPRRERRRGHRRRAGSHRARVPFGHGLGSDPSTDPEWPGSTRRFPAQSDYEASVRRAKEHIRAGDAYQIVLSQRAERATDVSALALYRALRRINPSPYHFLLELGDLALVGSSPETLVKLEGTREREPDRRDDRTGRRRRRSLARLGEGPRGARHARRPRAQRPLARLPRRHRARRALPRAGALLARHAPRLRGRGELLPGFTPFDLLRACFPAGTVSGAPKVGAMQIISELEGYRRGPYAGAGLRTSERQPRHLHRHPHDRPRRRPRAPAGGRGNRRRLRSGRRARGVPAKARRARSGHRALAEQNGSAP